jgi:hypothetical protein
LFPWFGFPARTADALAIGGIGTIIPIVLSLAPRARRPGQARPFDDMESGMVATDHAQARPPINWPWAEDRRGRSPLP